VKNPHPDWPFSWHSQFGGWDVVVERDGKYARPCVTAALAEKEGITTPEGLQAFTDKLVEREAQWE
jgi:hypothetical protein